MAALLLALAASAVASGGCTRVPLDDPKDYDLESTHKTVPLEGASELQARIEMAAGELNLHSDTTAAMDADFRYSKAAWQEPVVEYSVEESVGVLSVSQPNLDSGLEMVGPAHSTWDIGLTGDVPLDLDAKLGAGESSLDLSGLDVRSLNVLTGAGETTVDLTGPRTSDVGAVMTCGVGELRVHVPSQTGVRVRVLGGGIGDFTADGFTKSGDTYVNDAYETSDVKIEILLHRGIGSFQVDMVD
jgi:hypothetical protein